MTKSQLIEVDFRSELKERESEIELLQDTFKLIASELNLEKVFDTVAKRALQLVDAETVLIPILDKNNTTYTYKGGAGAHANEIIGESMPLECGVCGWVWKHKRAWWRGILNELSEQERNRWEKEAGTLILVPLQGRKSFLGGIAAINKQDGVEFTRRDLNLLSMFSGIVSIAIENAMSVKELEDTQNNLLEHQRRIDKLNKQYSESSEKVEQLTLYDSLTGLPNRTLFRDRVNTQLLIADREKQILSIVLIDINNFKAMNDALGHDCGDQILIEFCKKINKTLAPNETFSRLGSDEFILIIPETSASKTIKKIKLVISHFEDDFSIKHHDKLTINASFGISLFPEHGKDRSLLLRHADIALQTAKKNNSVFHVYDEVKDQANDTHASLAVDIGHAFNDNQFELYYQPKIDIKTNSIISAEALGRWKHPTKGDIPPDIFIDALEQYNSIDKYTYNAIDEAVINVKRWVSAGHNIKVAINISTKTLMNPEFINEIKSRITDPSVYKHIIFEITESLFLSHYDFVFDSLTRLRSLGIELSIDDFGTGYSSLSRLKKLPVNKLKIDQSFIKDMMESTDDQIIVRSIIDLAHNLGLTVVAEGVETKEILDRLNALGCDIAQGYLISHPIPAKDFEIFLNTYDNI